MNNRTLCDLIFFQKVKVTTTNLFPRPIPAAAAAAAAAADDDDDDDDVFIFCLLYTSDAADE